MLIDLVTRQIDSESAWPVESVHVLASPVGSTMIVLTMWSCLQEKAAAIDDLATESPGAEGGLRPACMLKGRAASRTVHRLPFVVSL